MSHFTVLVIGENFEEQLAPYDENIEVEKYKEYREDLSFYNDAWKRRNDPPPPQRSLAEALETDPLPEVDYSNVPDPPLDVLVEWLNEEWGEEFGHDEKGFFRWTTYNEKSKWDWYSVGGRWSGYFKLKEGVMDRPESLAVLGRPGAFDNLPEHDADIVRKGDVDVEFMRNEAGEKAGERWDRAQRVFGDLPVALSWDQVMAKYEIPAEIDEARKEYHAQPRVAAMREHDQACMNEDRQEDVICGFFGSIEDFQVTRESYVQDARDNRIAPYAYVKDGEWFAPGEMGWWGVSTDRDKDRRRFVRQFNEMFDELPDDTILTLVDCHV